MIEKNWIDIEEYPFDPRFLELPEGRMHYIDEGIGEPIVMIHGTPVWSFVYRNLIKALSSNYRSIARSEITAAKCTANPSNLGFSKTSQFYVVTIKISCFCIACRKPKYPLPEGFATGVLQNKSPI